MDKNSAKECFRCGTKVRKNKDGEWPSKCVMCDTKIVSKTAGWDDIMKEAFEIPEGFRPWRCPNCDGWLNLDRDGDWRCDQCNSAWADTGDGPDFDDFFVCENCGDEIDPVSLRCQECDGPPE